MIKLAALVRAHARADTLRVVLSELKRYQTFLGLDVHIFAMLDRPTPEVTDVAFSFTDYGHQCSIPILDKGRERFLEAQNCHLEYLEREFNPDWVYVVDDDFWFEPVRVTSALVPALSTTEFDAYYCPVVFIQDALDTYNPDSHHESIRLYRHVSRARFSGKRMLSMPDGPHDDAIITGRVARFPAPILEYGGFDAESRRRNIDAYARAGKVDAFTQALNSPRRLRFPADYDPSYGEWASLYPSAPAPVGSFLPQPTK